MSERIEKLRDLAARAYNCKATHVSSTAVVEVFDGKVIWEGVVETFDLEGCSLSNRCYGFKFIDWTNPNDAGKLVLHVPPLVDSPQTAVKIAIASKIARHP